MKPDDPLNDWNQLAHRARPDRPLAIDVASLLRSLPALSDTRSSASSGSFLEEFSALFSPTRTMLASLALAVVVIGGLSWQGWSTWEDVSALKEIVSIAFGGVA